MSNKCPGQFSQNNNNFPRAQWTRWIIMPQLRQQICTYRVANLEKIEDT